MKRFKKWSSFLLSLCMILALFPAATSPVNAASASAKYKDVVQTEWYVPYVDYVVEHGFMTGTSSTTFGPNGKVTRAQYVQVLYALAEKPSGAKAAGFKDVASDKWYTDAVNWAAYVGVTGGMTKTTFAPDQAVTREQAATFFKAYAEKVLKEKTSDIADLSVYTDADKVSNYAKITVAWAVNRGLINSTIVGKKVLSPQGVVTRAQLATMLRGFTQNIRQESRPINVVKKETREKEKDSLTIYENGDIVYSPKDDSIAGDSVAAKIFYNNIIDVFTFEDLTASKADRIADSVSGTIVGDISGTVNFLQIKIEKSTLQRIEQYCSRIMDFEEVMLAQVSVPYEINIESNSDPWSSDPQKPISDRGRELSPGGNDWWAEAVHAYSAWNIVDNLRNVKAPTIGIVDTGVDNTHEDLSKTVIFPIEYTNNSYIGLDDHGTAVAGIIAANNNNVGIRGISNHSKLLCVDYTPFAGLSNITNTELLSNGKYIEAIKRMIDSNVKVINNSWGTVMYREGSVDVLPSISSLIHQHTDEKSSPEANEKYKKAKDNENTETAISCICLIASLLDSGKNKEFLICQSAGNGYFGVDVPFDASRNSYFASINEKAFNKMSGVTRQKLKKRGIDYSTIKDHIMIVGAARNEKVSQGCYSACAFSNYGDAVDIYAPGEGVFSTFPNNKYDSMGGTSVACPIVAGAAAVLWTVKPDLSAREVKSALVNCKTMDVKENVTGSLKPMLDIKAALKSVLGNQYVDPNKDKGKEQDKDKDKEPENDKDKEPENTVLPNGYIQIRNAQELNAVRNNREGNYILMNDIDLSSYDNWEPIGVVGEPFIGVLDGNGHKITNMKITCLDSDEMQTNLGLFGSTHNATIRNIGNITGQITFINCSGECSAGAIAGKISNSTISQCNSDVNIVYKNGTPTGTAKKLGLEYFIAGGIVGTAPGFDSYYYNNIEGCSACGTITGISDKATMKLGGIAGSGGQMDIDSCYSKCHLSATTDCIYVWMGGVLADSTYSTLLTNNTLEVHDCCSNCTIDCKAGSGGSVLIGGITGEDQNSDKTAIKSCCYLNSSSTTATGWESKAQAQGKTINASIDAKRCSKEEVNTAAKKLGFAP